MKNEYIIRDEAMTIPVLPKEQRLQFRNADEAFEEGWRQALENLAILPAADVVKVRHGRWKRRISWNCYVCSECSFENDKAYTFCPNCGAKMDGGQDDGTA